MDFVYGCLNGADGNGNFTFSGAIYASTGCTAQGSFRPLRPRVSTMVSPSPLRPGLSVGHLRGRMRALPGSSSVDLDSFS